MKLIFLQPAEQRDIDRRMLLISLRQRMLLKSKSKLARVWFSNVLLNQCLKIKLEMGGKAQRIARPA